VEPLDPNITRCHFCGTEIKDKLTAMAECKPVIRMVTEAYKDSSGVLQTREKVTSRVETIHACKDHVLEIRKPIVVRTV
jgi:hypothetical protein